MTWTTALRRHGPAGLLVALFAVAGLVSAYGIGHGPPPRICTEHAVTAPAGALSDQTPHSTLSAPLKAPQDLPLHMCLSLAVLLGLVALGLAAGLRRPAVRLPARSGWVLAPPPRPPLPAPSPASLQVLRL